MQKSGDRILIGCVSLLSEDPSLPGREGQSRNEDSEWSSGTGGQGSAPHSLPGHSAPRRSGNEPTPVHDRAPKATTTANPPTGPSVPEVGFSLDEGAGRTFIDERDLLLDGNPRGLVDAPSLIFTLWVSRLGRRLSFSRSVWFSVLGRGEL